MCDDLITALLSHLKRDVLLAILLFFHCTCTWATLMWLSQLLYVAPHLFYPPWWSCEKERRTRAAWRDDGERQEGGCDEKKRHVVVRGSVSCIPVAPVLPHGHLIPRMRIACAARMYIGLWLMARRLPYVARNFDVRGERPSGHAIPHAKDR